VSNLPTVSSGYSELYCWSETRAERAENQVERSGARSGRSRSGNGAGSGGYRNRL